MEFRLYCELKVNDRKSGKLLTVVSGIYYIDEEDIQFVLRAAEADETADAIACIREALEDWLKKDLPENVRGGEVIYDFDIIYLDDEAFDGEEDDGE